ncbi:GNAT superfamily N-acetyltransferase [Paenibacillus endophyticus]|uniref:GNAT superfamily N-acetyltransferase n=2 Tax=Paenibacillus endophyticus TaxID=1294268 RepID=A0A7W5CCS1_9BACL|nr:GNAT family N-acetyltransferase [Paenibacillus endophyticus]MBB3155323.1 GNAT superfamily N-acetyltransferase [Paenibacillus endophyticus]
MTRVIQGQFEVFELKDKMTYFEEAVHMFWEQWGSETNYRFYYDCMLHACGPGSDLPRFYLLMQHDVIIGTYALLRNDLISRQDIFPWLACLYVAPEHRGNRIGSALMEHALRESGKKGYERLYLCTELDGYYEKNGWSLEANGYLFNGEETKIYGRSTGRIASV